MQNNPGPQNDTDSAAILVLFAIACSIVGAAWVGGNLSALLLHQKTLGVPFTDGLKVLTRLPKHMSEPKLAWPTPAQPLLPGPVLYWICTAFVVVAVVAIAISLAKVFSNRPEPLDKRKRLGVETQARLAKRSDLHPLIVKGPMPNRFLLGHFNRRTLLATEDPGIPRTRRARRDGSGRGAVMYVGPSRSGKTTAAMHGARNWLGPAVIMSVKTDVLFGTIKERSAMGDIKIFDPCEVSGKGNASWTPLRNAKTVEGAQQAAHMLCSFAPRGNQRDGDHWLTQAEMLLSNLMWLAANTTGTTMEDVDMWVSNHAEHKDKTITPLLRALSDHENRVIARYAERALGELEGIAALAPETSGSIYSTARDAVKPWKDPRVARWSSRCDITFNWLTNGSNTLYVIVPPDQPQRFAATLGGLIADLVSQAFARSNRTGQPLDPSLLLFIDEAANAKLRDLPEWASTVAGIGVQLVTVWQSIAQIEENYKTESQSVLTNHLSKIFFSGISDLTGLHYISDLVGAEHLPSALSTNPTRSLSTSTQVEFSPIDLLRRLPRQQQLLLHGTRQPAAISHKSVLK
jgi:type IV secretion system protein VirD4